MGCGTESNPLECKAKSLLFSEVCPKRETDWSRDTIADCLVGRGSAIARKPLLTGCQRPMAITATSKLTQKVEDLLNRLEDDVPRVERARAVREVLREAARQQTAPAAAGRTAVRGSGKALLAGVGVSVHSGHSSRPSVRSGCGRRSNSSKCIAGSWLTSPCARNRCAGWSGQGRSRRRRH